MSAPQEPTALYRLYDAEGVLLYIGISIDPEERRKVHGHGPDRKAWGQLIASQTVEWYESRGAALAAEEIAIRRERPPHNGTHNYPLAPFAADRWPQIKERRGRLNAVADLIRTEIRQGRWVVGEKIPSCWPRPRGSARPQPTSRSAAYKTRVSLNSASAGAYSSPPGPSCLTTSSDSSASRADCTTLIHTRERPGGHHPPGRFNQRL